MIPFGSISTGIIVKYSNNLSNLDSILEVGLRLFLRYETNSFFDSSLNESSLSMLFFISPEVMNNWIL